MTSTEYIGMDVYKESISIAVQLGWQSSDRMRHRDQSQRDSAVFERTERRLARYVLRKEPQLPGCMTC